MHPEYAVTLERVLRAERALVWAIVADTNRWDRAAGLAPPRYRWAVIDGARVRVGASRELGLTLEFVEPPYRWIEGRMLEGERRFIRGPVSAGGFTVVLDEAPGGATRVRAKAWVRGPWWVGITQRMKFARALPRYLDAVAQLLETLVDAPLGQGDVEPAVVRARRLLARAFDAPISGARSPVADDELGQRLGRLATSSGHARHITLLERTLRDAPDDEVATLRPFEVARGWQADRRDVLRTFLHATEAGLLDMRWQINCPVCRVGSANAGRMAEVGRSAHCEACDIDYGVDFARHVEAVFAPNPSVRRAQQRLFCASSPAFLPHVLAQLTATAHTTTTHAIDLAPGTLHVRVLGSSLVADVTISDPRTKLRITVTDDTLTVDASTSESAHAVVAIESQTRADHVVLIERSDWSADAALGTVVATFPEFVRLFATEAPASGVELTVGEVALVFTDLTGSTALYERIGDARAFALVEAHFREMTTVIEAEGGAVIKTMGDAVMASFPTLEEAVRASLAMVRAHDVTFGTHDLHVKVGVHAGPSLAVRANDRFDFFGTTVNVAARLQAQARSGEVVLMETAASHPRIATILADLPRRVFDADLKGIAATQSLVAVHVSHGGPRVLPRGEST